MKTLIIGCGYVGLALGAELARRGHAVFGLRRSAVADADLGAAGITPLRADISQPETLTKLPTGFEWVVHCAASGGGGVEGYRRVYLEGTRNLVAWLAPSPPRKFVYTSSTGLYAQDDGSLVTESSPTRPDSDTGRVLLKTEEVLREAVRGRGFPAVILRVAGIYGPGRGFYLREFLRGEARIEGDGNRPVNMVHRDDLITAIIAGLERGEPGAVYNTCDDLPAPMREVYAWLAEKLDRPMPPSVPKDAAASRRRGLTNKRISNRRLRTELDWNPAFPTFRDGYAAELARLNTGSS